jgi:hypothetical protein
MPPVRPKSVTVISIFGIIFGALGCVCIIGVSAWSFAMQGEQREQMSSSMLVFGIITGVAGLVLSIVLLVGSIAALGMKRWARSALMGFAVVDLMYDVAKLVICVVWILPMMEPMFRNNPQMRANPNMNIEQMIKFAKIVSIVQWGLIAAATISLALAILIVMSQPKVKAAFDAQSGAAM